MPGSRFDQKQYYTQQGKNSKVENIDIFEDKGEYQGDVIQDYFNIETRLWLTAKYY